MLKIPFKKPKLALSSISEAVQEFATPEAPPASPLTSEHATAMTDRTSFANLFTYRYFDNDTKLCYLDDGEDRAIGFGLLISPLNFAGIDAEAQIEAIITALPVNSIVQFAKLVTPQVAPSIDRWAHSRMKSNSNEFLRMITVARRQFYLNTVDKLSMLPDGEFHPRMTQHYCLVRIPYEESVSDISELNMFIQQVKDTRSTVEGALSSMKISTQQMLESDFKLLLREMLNPHVEPSARINEINPSIPLSQDMLMRNTRVTIRDDGRIGFSGKAGEPEVVMTALTVDAAPSHLFLPAMGEVLGSRTSRDERITSPYWAYTTIHVLHADRAKDDLTAKFGLINKQTMSESQWFRSMMGELFERKNRIELLLSQTNKGRRLVRAYSGINVYSYADKARRETEYIRGLYSRQGFKLSPEVRITMPVFVASMPLQYVHTMDPPNQGLQRAWLMSSTNAASMVHLQGDWRGTGFENGGVLVASRQGQIASFDLLKTTTNYNFVVVASSGSGKSFVTNDIIADFLTKGGIARMIDVGRSYEKFCNMMGGENIQFSNSNPMSINPFSGLGPADFMDMMPMFRDLLRIMAFPNIPEEQTPANEIALLDFALQHAYSEKGPDMELKDVTDFLQNFDGDNRLVGPRLAMQLRPFSEGRYAKWFSGPRTVEFSKSFVVIELEELKQDPVLQSVVLQVVMFQVTREMYQMPREVPKLLAIDEAWDLMGGMKTGKFIETAFRRIRKYNGIAGVITQSFEDFEKSEAARATIENAEWQFILSQRPESINFAVDHKRISVDEYTVSLLQSVKTSKGRSEIFIRGGGGAGVYTFIVDKHSYYIYTTNAREDLTPLNALVQDGYSMTEAVNIMADKAYRNMWGDNYRSKVKYLFDLDEIGAS